MKISIKRTKELLRNLKKVSTKEKYREMLLHGYIAAKVDRHRTLARVLFKHSVDEYGDVTNFHRALQEHITKVTKKLEEQKEKAGELIDGVAVDLDKPLPEEDPWENGELGQDPEFVKVTLPEEESQIEKDMGITPENKNG